MHKKFEINRTKIKGGCQSGRKVVTHNSKSDLPLVSDRTRFLLISYDNTYLSPNSDPCHKNEKKNLISFRTTMGKVTMLFNNAGIMPW